MRQMIRIFAASVAVFVVAAAAYAGGDPQFVKFPAGYKDSFTRLCHRQSGPNRSSWRCFMPMTPLLRHTGFPTAMPVSMPVWVGPGSIMVMEVYKPRKDDTGAALLTEEGLYVPDKLAAVAVMERRDDWDEAFPADHRINGWGFSIYQPDGTPKPMILIAWGVTHHLPGRTTALVPLILIAISPKASMTVSPVSG